MDILVTLPSPADCFIVMEVCSWAEWANNITINITLGICSWVDRLSREGGALAFFIRDVKYQSIDVSLDQTSDLKIQGVEIFWRGMSLHILYVYHPSKPKSSAHKFF
ncbi:hypothetical protein TNCV_3699331 [Trichonephila clavipes]|uniref:Uncharacterized protein n=1 Tax=Trichonephila clavipes TaxID=2585209 RepID=A0A8X6SIV4_TRICX|nr:hypothetical protein TNCV_3699331 [Trichonephila clavipes]